MDEYLEQIAEALKAAADCTVTDADVADAERVVETVERMLRTKDAQARELIDERHAHAADLRELNEACNDLAAARSMLDVMRDRYAAACTERSTAQDMLSEARADAVHWRGEMLAWQNRYEGMKAALRVALEVQP